MIFGPQYSAKKTIFQVGKDKRTNGSIGKSVRPKREDFGQHFKLCLDISNA